MIDAPACSTALMSAIVPDASFSWNNTDRLFNCTDVESDVFEIMRGKCNRLQSVPNEISLLTTNLPLGYNRDLQLLKDIIFPATTTLCQCIDMCDFMLQHIVVRENILDDERYNYLFTVEDVNRLTLSGVPFREAYRTIGGQVQRGEYKPTREVQHTHEGSIGNLCNDKIADKMNKVVEKFAF